MPTSIMKPTTRRTKENSPIRGVGIVEGNPKRCLICQKEIRNGDRWIKYTSPSEPDLPAYSIIVHEFCERKAR